MADNTRVNELQEKLLKAIDILNAQALNSISFDKTITCKIESDKDKKDGKYEVNDGNRIFTAYSTDTSFRTGDTVYVTVPEGKFENQKMIIGKKTADNDKPFNFTQPFDTFFDMTGNLAVGAIPVEAVANYEEHKRITILYEKDEQGNIIPLDVSNKDIIKYTRLAIRANFRSWIKNAVSGNYGIDIILTTDKPNTSTGDTKNGTYTYRFDSSMFYGNPYNFETYYSQELVLDLEKQDIGKVTGIKVDFYQDDPFKDKQNIDLPFEEQDGNLLASNLFVDNLEIYFGKDISTFTSDMVEIYTANSGSYIRSVSTDLEIAQKEIEANKKQIKIRWVHLKDGIPINMNLEENRKNIDYEIRWYKYRVGVPAVDEYCGIYWEYVEKENISEDNFTYILNPNVNKQQEHIKAIILCNNIPYHSNELIFKNDNDLPPSQEAQYIMNALSIECDDNSNGNYMIYGQDDNIKDTTYSKETRTLTAYFDSDNDGNVESKVQPSDHLVWIFPANNTMINLLNSDIKNEEKLYTVTNAQPKYTISSYYSPDKSNNTIICKYTLNGVVYTTEKEFTFGPSGTMGTDQTLVIDFVGDKKSISVDDEICQLQVQLYDKQNKLVSDLNNIKWSWFYRSDENISITEGEETKRIINLKFKNNKPNIDGLYIIQVNIGNLETYFPLPISNGYSYIKGPTQVIYQSNGEPAYSREEYQLYHVENNVSVKWQIKAAQTDQYKYQFATNFKSQNEIKISEIEYKNKPYYTKGVSGSYNIVPFESLTIGTDYYYQIKNPYCADLSSNNQLQPLGIYVKNAPVYGVQALIGTTIVWTQPILVIQNKWPNAMVNAWDGKSLTLDYEKNTILTAAIAAGSKNSDNEFSGVMIGDWSDTDTQDSVAGMTGIYGFHEGAMSYALTEDGKAFFGKDGKGRIYINGDDATIYSPGYDNPQDKGMMIDLNDPYIILKKENDSLQDTDTYPFQIGKNFRVNWNGDTYLGSGTIYSGDGTIDLIGKIQVLNNDINNTLLGTIGYITSDIPNTSPGQGIGIESSGGVLKITEKNIGMKYTNLHGATYFTINNNEDDGWADIYLGGDATRIYFDVPAINQYGIYARFA